MLIANNYSAGYTGNPASPDINVEGIDVVYTNGYPDGNSIAPLAGITAPDYGGAVNGDGSVTLYPDANHTSCTIIYTPAAAPSGSPPVYSQPTYDATGLTLSNCG